MAFPADLANMPVLGEAAPIPMPASNPAALKTAADAIVAALASAKSACLLAGILVARAHADVGRVLLVEQAEAQAAPLVALMMKRTLISYYGPKAFGSRHEASERFFTKFALLEPILIDASCRQEWKPAGVAKLQQAIEMAMTAVHLMSGARPVDATSLRQIAIADAFLADGGFFQSSERAFQIEQMFELSSSRVLLQQLTIEAGRGRLLSFVVFDPLIDLRIRQGGE